MTRRSALKAGAALAAVPLIKAFPTEASAPVVFSTGWVEVDRALNGGMRLGTLLVVIGTRGSGKSAFLLRLAKSNGIVDAHAMNQGPSDMLSIMQGQDGKYIGSLMLNAGEPMTDKERLEMQRVPEARDAFLTRWFGRTKEVLAESGGIFALSADGEIPTSHVEWMKIPDYIVHARDSAYHVIKSR